MDFTFDGVKYEIIPIPPSLSPFSTRIGNLLKTKPETYEDAETISVELAKAMDKLLAGTVTPTPAPKHQTQIFNTLIDLSNKTIEDAHFFRSDKRPDAPQNGALESPVAQASK